MHDSIRTLLVGVTVAVATLAIHWALGLASLQDAHATRDEPPWLVVGAG